MSGGRLTGTTLRLTLPTRPAFLSAIAELHVSDFSLKSLRHLMWNAVQRKDPTCTVTHTRSQRSQRLLLGTHPPPPAGRVTLTAPHSILICTWVRLRATWSVCDSERGGQADTTFIPQKYIQGATAFPQVQLYPRDSANVIPWAHKAGRRVTLSARQPPLSYSLTIISLGYFN